MKSDELQACVLDVLRATYAELQRQEPPDLGPDTRLYGGADGLDSVMLVTFLADLEAKVNEHYGVSVILADHRAVSARTSPFRRVGTLVELLAERLREAGVEVEGTS